MIILRENEQVIKMVRQHRSVIAGAMIWPVVLTSLVTFALLRSDLNKLGYSWEIATGVILIATLIILYKIYIWRKNAFIITNQRVVLHVRHGAFARTVTELLYKDIYDISFKQIGLGALLYRYGTLVIKTPSDSEITFDKVSSPADIVEIINKIRANTSIR